ncbi:MAG: PRC-barrel domain containing protein [Methanosarcina sp.]|nr:PRC-barrel domain containing protein [Methanosarcina sp.]
MSKEFARNLFNKQVMATDGTEIGTLNNIVVEIKGGNIIDMLVTPNPNFDTSRYRKANNFILIPFDSVSAIKDYIIID